MKFSHLLIPVVILISLSARAQEETPIIEGPDPFHREVNYNEDKTLIYDQSVQHPGVKDSVQAVVPKTISRTTRPETPREGQKPRHEEDALKFNFLFYIIQKYKLSDLIEN